MSFFLLNDAKHAGQSLGKKIVGSGFGRFVWQRRRLPSAGAEQYAFETYGTPVYDFALGNGATFVRKPLKETQPAQWQNFTWPILANPPLNVFQGQIATQPLMDPNTAVALGIAQSGAIPEGPYSVLQPAAPEFAP